MTAIRDLKSDFSTLLQDFKSLPNHLKIVGILYFLVCPLVTLFYHSGEYIFYLNIAFLFMNKGKEQTIEDFKKCNLVEDKIFWFFFFSLFVWILISCSLSDHAPKLRYASRIFRNLFSALFLFSLIKSLKYEYKSFFLKVLMLGGVLSVILFFVVYFSNSILLIRKGSIESSFTPLFFILSEIVLLVFFTNFKNTIKYMFFSSIVLAFLMKVADAAILAFFLQLIVLLFLITGRKKIIEYIYIFYFIVGFAFLPNLINFVLSNSNYIKILSQSFIANEPSWVSRLSIFKRCVELISAKKIFGHGVDFFKFLNEKIMITIFNPNSQCFEYSAHPHNHIIQFWLEFGFIGIILYSMVSILILKKILKMNSYGPLLFFTAIQTHLLVAINIWYPWWWSFVFLIFPLLIDNEEETEIKN